LTVYLSSIVGSPSIGVYSLATEHMVMIPQMVPDDKAKEYADWLQVPLIHTSISGSVLIGSLVCANSNGLLFHRRSDAKNLNASKPFSKATSRSWKPKKPLSATSF
jgi:translation initiation factor 6